MKSKGYDYIEPSDEDCIRYKLDGCTLIAIINQCYTLYQNIEDNKFYIAYRGHINVIKPNVIYYANDRLEQFKEMLSVFSNYEDSKRKLFNYVYHDNGNESNTEVVINYSDKYKFNKSLLMFKHFISKVYKLDKTLFKVNERIGFNDAFINNRLMFGIHSINESVVDLHEGNYNIMVKSLMIDELGNVVEYNEIKHKLLNCNKLSFDENDLPF